MKVLVTGGGGFIGRHCMKKLADSGYQVYAIYRTTPLEINGVDYIKGNLLESDSHEGILEKIQPSHLLHMAWTTGHGSYWTDPQNFEWVNASISLVKKFYDLGGQRAVIAGTCAEYDWSYNYCDEYLTPTVPATLYGLSKLELQAKLSLISDKINSNTVFGRIFSLYGPYEDPQRFVPSLITKLMDGKKAVCENPNLIRDYLHVEDVASAFIALLESELTGAVNIGSGYGISLGDIALKIEEKFNVNSYLQRAEKASPRDRRQELIANPSRLMSTGWRPKYCLDNGIEHTINWWKTNAQFINFE